MASIAGNLVGTAPDWYSSAKAGIVGFTRHLAAYRSDEVRANAVGPGMTDTPRLAGYAASPRGHRSLSRIPLHRMATPDDIGWPTLFLLVALGFLRQRRLLGGRRRLDGHPMTRVGTAAMWN